MMDLDKFMQGVDRLMSLIDEKLMYAKTATVDDRLELHHIKLELRWKHAALASHQDKTTHKWNKLYDKMYEEYRAMKRPDGKFYTHTEAKDIAKMKANVSYGQYLIPHTMSAVSKAPNDIWDMIIHLNQEYKYQNDLYIPNQDENR